MSTAATSGATTRPSGPARRAAPHGWRLWYAVFAPTGLWLAHLIALAALAPIACDRIGVEAVMHALTVVLSLLTVLAIWWSWSRWRTAGTADHEADSRPGLDRFWGTVGLLNGAINLLLIVWEGAYVVFFPACS